MAERVSAVAFAAGKSLVRRHFEGRFPYRNEQGLICIQNPYFAFGRDFKLFLKGLETKEGSISRVLEERIIG